MEYHENGRSFRFNADLTRTAVNPQLLVGLDVHDETTGRLLGLICVQPVLPMPVHGSPLVAALMARTKVPWQPRYVGAVESLWTLRQLYTLCIGGALPGPPDAEGKPSMIGRVQLGELGQAFQDQVRERETQLHENLDGVYAEYVRALNAGESLGDTRKRALQQFITLLEMHTLGHIHDIEKLLYLAVLGEHHIRLEQVLTPVKPLVHADQVIDKDRLRRSTEQFFRTKVAVINKKMRLLDTAYEPREFIRASFTDPLWRGYVSRQTLWDYFVSLDTKEQLGVLEKN